MQDLLTAQLEITEVFAHVNRDSQETPMVLLVVQVRFPVSYIVEWTFVKSISMWSIKITSLAMSSKLMRIL